MRTTLLGVTMFLVALTPPTSAADAPAGPRPGDFYPVLTLPSLADGTPLSIGRFRGRKLLLHQFASW